MQDQHKLNILGRLNNTSPHVLLLFVLVLICLAYSNTLNSPPVLDDRATFINNPIVYIDNLSLDSLKQVYDGRFGKTRFIPMFSFAIDHLLGQGSIVQFHLTNILIHLLATIAVYLLVLGLANTAIGKKSLTFINPGIFSLFVAALWALHPIQTNGVTYLVQRMASFAALFYFSALASYIWARSRKSGPVKILMWASFPLFMLCAFMSKENTATLPIVVLMVEILFITPEFGRKIIDKIIQYRRLAIAVVFLLIIPLALIELTSIASSYADVGRHFNITERLFTELRVIVFYLSLLALPLSRRLNLDHDFPISPSLLTPLSTILALLFLALLIFAAFRLRRQNPFAAFGIFFFLINLLIESSVIPLEIVFEHRLYLPSLGFMIVTISLLDWASRLTPTTDKNELKTIFLLGMTITLCTLAVTTSLRNHTWRDRLTLYEDIAAKSPLKPRVHTNMGMTLANADRHEEALTALQKAISLGKGQSEEYIKAANNIVTIFVSQEKFQEGADRAEKLIKDRPQERLNLDGFPKLMANLGTAYWKIGRFSDSLEAFRIGIKTHHTRHTPLLLGGMEAMLLDGSTSNEGRHQLGLGKGTESIYIKMATVLLLDNDLINARVYLAKALAIAPADAKALAIKNTIADETKRNQLSREAISNASQPEVSTGLRFKSAFYIATFIETNLPLLQPLVGPLLKKAVQFEPKSLSGALKLARWQLKNGEIDSALNLAERLLKEAPDLPPLLELSAKCYFVQGEHEKVVDLLKRLLEIYPSHPSWERYSRFIRNYNENPKLSEQITP